jgi:Recombination protein O N terminal.
MVPVLLSTTAFILRVDALSEKDVAATLLTRDAGLLRAAFRGRAGAFATERSSSS